VKINAKVTILFSRDGMSIEVYDEDAAITFLELELSPQQACQALSRLSHTEATTCEVRGLDNVGKKHEWKNITFEIPQVDDRDEQVQVAIEEAKKHIPEGWSASTYNGSQVSFFKMYGKQYAKITIRRWVDRGEE
jgi:hypothetical protein